MPSGRQCGVCRLPGHNARTCVHRQNTIGCTVCGLMDHDTRMCPQRHRAIDHFCGLCRSAGHNSRTCPQRKAAVNTCCGVCRLPGHNARTCPRRSEKNPENSEDGGDLGQGSGRDQEHSPQSQKRVITVDPSPRLHASFAPSLPNAAYTPLGTDKVPYSSATPGLAINQLWHS